MRTTSSISFFARPSKANKKGLCPLECSITICGVRKFINLPMQVDPKEFNSPHPPQYLIETMDLWRSRINGYMLEILKDGRELTAQSLREVIQSGGIKAYSVNNLFQEKLNVLKRRIGYSLKKEVYRKYELVYERFLEYIDGDSDVSKITPALIQIVEIDWRKRFDPATTCGYLTRLKSFIRFGIDNGRLTKNPMLNVKVSKPKKEIKYLTEQQIETLRHAVMPNSSLRRTLDCFLFMIASGLAYADTKSITSNDLMQYGDYHYITKKRIKTGRTYTAIILSWGVPILQFYGTLPMISNQKMNVQLKQIGEIVGIPGLTTHYARRSYSMFFYNKGLDLGTLSALIGDNETVCKTYYAQLLTPTILEKATSVL